VFTFDWTAASTSVEIPIANSLIFDWITNPGNNAGLLLIPTVGSTANSISANFASSEAAIAGERPTLEFTYTVPEPDTMALGIGVVALAVAWNRRRRR
jgi:hypothetical protein